MLTCFLIQADLCATVHAASPSLAAKPPRSAALAPSRVQASVRADDLVMMRPQPLGAAQPVLPAAAPGPPAMRMSKARQKLLADQAAREAGLAAQEAAEETGRDAARKRRLDFRV